MRGEHSILFGRLALRACGVRKGVGPCRGGVGPRAGWRADRAARAEPVSVVFTESYGRAELARQGEGVGVYTCVGPFKAKI